MLLVAITCFALGVLLGVRHNVYILLPATIGAGGMFVAVTAAVGFTVWMIVLGLVLVAACLQIGYLSGLAVNNIHLLARPVEPLMHGERAARPNRVH